VNSDITQAITGNKADVVMQWLTWADKDYVAARRLLLEGLLVQGTSLANTAIEKYLKAILTVHDQTVVRIHDPLKLYQSLPISDSLQLDISFLTLLGKAYKMRYPDDLPFGYNISLCQFLLLHALDESIAKITAKFDWKTRDGNSAVRLLNALINDKDPNATLHNVALGAISKDELFALPSKVYENRRLNNGAWMEIDYVTATIENESFDHEGFVQINDRQFNLSHLPLGQQPS